MTDRRPDLDALRAARAAADRIADDTAVVTQAEQVVIDARVADLTRSRQTAAAVSPPPAGI